MISYPPNLLTSEKSYTEAIQNAAEIRDALNGLLKNQQMAEDQEPLHSLFSSRRAILQSELKAISGEKSLKSQGFSLN